MHICRFGDFFFLIGKAQHEYMWLDPCYLEKYSGGEMVRVRITICSMTVCAAS